MRSERLLNLQTPSESTQQEAIRTEGKMARMDESLEHIQSDVQRTRVQVDRHLEQYGSHVRRTKALWVIAVVLVLTLLGMAWLGSPYITEHRAMFAQLPAVNNLLQGLGERVNSVESKLNVQTAAGASMTDRLTKVEQSVSSNLRSARDQAQTFATQVGQRMRADLNQSLVAIQNRLNGVEDTQRESIDHVAKLEGELANLRQELASVREQTANQLTAAQQLSRAQQLTTNDVFEMKGKVESNTGKIDRVSDHLSRQRTDFEISKNRTEQVAPGAYLTVRQVDVRKQNVDGWLQLANEGRIVWIHGQGAQRPITFVTQQEQREHELVFTRIGTDSVAGYVLVPAPTPVANAFVSKK